MVTAQKGLKAANRNVKSAEQEKKVAEEIKGDGYDIKCCVCGEILGDIDAANAEVANEVKNTAKDYKPSQLAQLAAVAKEFLGAGVVAHMAVPHSQKAAMEAMDPKNLAGNVQGHAI